MEQQIFQNDVTWNVARHPRGVAAKTSTLKILSMCGKCVETKNSCLLLVEK
jgi:hypothetical protein